MKKNLKKLLEILPEKKGYIFDMDGTLVDLEELNYTTFASIIERHLKREFTQADYQNYFSGAGSTNGFTKYLKAYDLEGSVEELVEKYRANKKEILHTRFHEVVTLKEGAVELLDLLRSKDIKLALATSSFREFAKFITESLKIYDKFDIFLTESDINKNKPDPEIFNLAQERLGIPKDQCIIFEDSLNGVKSALASGIYCVGLFNQGLNDDFIEKADSVIETFRDIVVNI